MNYDYKMTEIDPNKAFVKRAALYVAILLAIVSLALIILCFLFERYLLLLLPAGMLLLASVIWFVIGRLSCAFSYHLTANRLEIKNGGKLLLAADYADLLIERNAENEDFSDKDIIKFAFLKCRMDLKNLSGNNAVPTLKIVSFGQKRYLLAFDAYAMSLLGRIDHA